MAQIGIGMIEMYVDLITKDFEPILVELAAYESRLKEQVIEEVRRDMGIADLILQRAELRATLEELDTKIARVEGNKYDSNNPLDSEVKSRLSKRLNGTSKEVHEVINNLIRRVKLAGVSTEMKNVFEQIPKVLEELKTKVKSLPAPETIQTAQKRKRISH